MLSLKIHNARIVDGSGEPSFQGDVGVSGDKIVAIGRIDTPAIREIDAAGKVLAPGFVDIHTHYDPQLCWDRNASPTPEHGVTSLVMGNCSISLAPVRTADRDRVIALFGSVEDMESRLLSDTIPFSWETVADYLTFLRQGIGPNVGSLVGHSVLRLYVMGEDAQRRSATDGEITQMCTLLQESLAAGAFGLSFTFNHFDERGEQLPCYYADRREKLALLNTIARAGRGMVEVAPNFFVRDMGFPCIDEFGELARETGVMCSLSPILQLPNMPDAWRQILERFVTWQERGAPLYAQTQTRPLDMTVQLSHGSAVLSKYPSWRRSFELPIGERLAAYGDRAARETFAAEAAKAHKLLDVMTVKRGRTPTTQAMAGRRIVDIAVEERRSFMDTMLDIAIADNLDTEFSLDGFIHSDAGAVAELLDHPAVHIGSADAGAHITQFSGAGDTCYLFEKFVREDGAMSLERAVQRLTSELAERWNIQGRGRIATGQFADLVVFDPDLIARGKEEWVEDVPGGSGRYVRHPSGIDKVIVNGACLVDDGQYTDDKPGRLI
jgi:N-acyl-D-aspartate/D-glutamate deacylase